MSQVNETRREQLLSIASALIDEQRKPLRMSELAQRAGISRATLYRELGNRVAIERLLRARGALSSTASAHGSMRARVLAGARRAIAAHGLLRVTVEQIAKESDVGEASVYRAFKDKDALLSAAFDELPVRQDILLLLSDEDAPLRATLVTLVSSLLEFAAREPETLRLIAFGHGQEARYLKRLRQGQRSAYKKLIEYISVQQLRGRLVPANPELLVSALLGAVHASALLFSRRTSLTSVRALTDCEPGRDGELIEHASTLVDLFLLGAVPRHTKVRTA